MIIDFHAHLTEAPYGNEARLRNEYERSGITHGVLVPGGMIDVRDMTRYVTGEARPESTFPRNDLVAELTSRQPSRFSGFFCVDPSTGRDGADALERAFASGFRGLKLAPLVHEFSLSSPAVRSLLEICEAADRPVYTHTVYSPAARTPMAGYLASLHPRTPVVIGHMGFGPADRDAIRLAAERDNVFLETSGGSYIALEQALEEAGSHKLVYGSEFPLHNPLAELRKLECLTMDADAFKRITCGNALGLLGGLAEPIAKGGLEA